MLLANHVNNLIDPMLVMGFVGGRPRFLAKSTLWSHPIVAPLLLFIGAVPEGKSSGGHHTPTFYADDGTVPVAMRVMSALVLEGLGSRGR